MPARRPGRVRLRRRSQLLPERVAGEPPHPDVLTDGRDLLGHEVTHGPLLVAERLVEEAHVAIPLRELPREDLLPDLRGLARGRGVVEQLGLLRLEHVGGDLVGVDVLRREAGDLHREVLDELLELVGPRDEVRLAVDLDEHAEAAARVDVAAHEALARLAAGLLLRGGKTLLAQRGHSLVDVAVGRLERALAIHEAGAGQLAQLLDGRSRDLRHRAWISCRGGRRARAGAWVGWRVWARARLGSSRQPGGAGAACAGDRSGLSRRERPRRASPRRGGGRHPRARGRTTASRRRRAVRRGRPRPSRRTRARPSPWAPRPRARWPGPHAAAHPRSRRRRPAGTAAGSRGWRRRWPG